MCNTCDKKSLCEWFEVYEIGENDIEFDDMATRTVAIFKTYEEAKEFVLLNKSKQLFIDGWINKESPSLIWTGRILI